MCQHSIPLFRQQTYTPYLAPLQKSNSTFKWTRFPENPRECEEAVPRYAQNGSPRIIPSMETMISIQTETPSKEIKYLIDMRWSYLFMAPVPIFLVLPSYITLIPGRCHQIKRATPYEMIQELLPVVGPTVRRYLWVSIDGPRLNLHKERNR